MALTQEQIERMDAITGFAPVKENNLEQNTINLSDDEFKKMDEITGLKPLKEIQQTQPIQEIDEIEEEIKRKNPDDYANWKSKEPISAYNAAKNAAREFNGTYNNIDENANLNWFENFLKNSEWSKNRSASVHSKIAQEKEESKQREQRINEGSATLGDKISNAFKNAAQSNIQDAQQKAQINKVAQGVNEADKTSRYEVSGVTKSGQPIYREIDLLEQIGFLEGMQKNLSKNIPVIGALADGADNKKQREIKDKILKGEPIRQDELNYLNYATKRKQEEYVRGYSTTGQIGQGTIDSLGISADIMIGSMLSGVLGIGSIASKAANVSGKLAPVVNWGVNTGLGSGVALLANPQRIYAKYQERMIGNEMKVTDSGMMIFQESEEKPATALIKSIKELYLMYFTELGGGQLLRGIGSGIAKGANAIVNKVDGGRSATVMAKLMEKNPKLKNFLDKTTSELSKRYEQLKGMPVVGKSTGWIKDKAHFDGFLEEMGEEALEDVLNLTFGVNNEERSLENYIDAIFKSPEEWAIIAGTIAISGAGLSATSYLLGEKMAEAGATQEDIEDVFLNTTENQKKELISEQMENGNIDIVESAKYQIQNRDYNLELDNKQIEVENTIYNKLLKGNVQKDVALANAKLFSDKFRKLETEKARETFLQQLNKLDVEYNIPAEQRENGVYQQAAKDFVGIAGANENEVKDAQREWKEKGTESKYFKKWTDDAPLVSVENSNNYDFKTGEKVAVEGYHGTTNYEVKKTWNAKMGWYDNEYKEFDVFKNTIPNQVGHFFVNNEDNAGGYGDRIYHTYISFKNPLVIDCNNQTYDEITFDNKTMDTYSWAKFAKRSGYDGVIFKNIIDGADYSDLETSNTEYVPFKSNQIKSVDNRGTFDAQNPNIYYQALEFKFINEIKKNIQKMPKKVSDFQKMKIFEPIKHYFDVIKNVPVKNMTQKIKDRLGLEDNSMGAYDPTDKTIYLNYDLINEGESTALLHTFIHEAEHAKQKILLNFAYNNIDNPNLSAQEKYQLHLFLMANNRNDDAINNLFKYIGAKGFKSTEEFDYKARDLYNKYKKAPMELMADNIALVMQYEIGDRNEEQISHFRGEYRSILENGANEVYARGRILSKNWAIQNIRVYNERIATEKRRISDTGILYQSANQNNILFQLGRNSYNEEKKNLVADVYKDQVKFYNGEWIHRSLLEKKGIDFEKVEIGDYLDYFEESAREPRAEYNPEFDNIAKEYFGTTTNLNEAGYILNDGSLLDLSGKNMGGEAGRRSLDHREVNSAFIETENPDYEDVGFNEFIDNGAIRFMPEANSFLIARMPSEKQFEELKKNINKKNGEVFIELVDEMEYWGSESHSFRKEYERFSNANKILDDVRTFFNGGKISKFKKYFQEQEQNNLIAGYTPLEVMTKSQELYEKLGDIENPVSEEEAARILAKNNILIDAMEANTHKEDFNPQQLEDLFLNVYYIMNNQEIPEEIIEEEAKSQRTYADYKEIHNRRKEQQEEAYRGYYMEGADKDLITIMSNQDASTALHELAHWYLNALNEMAKVDEASRKQLEEVDNWLGRSGDYTVSQQEKFARSFEAYLYKGKAPNSYLKEVFENFKQWLKSVYAHITEIEAKGADISKEVQEMFDRMFSSDEYYQERKQVNELLKNIKTKAKREKRTEQKQNSELDDVQKRHKKVSYEILSAAANKSEKYLKTIFETDSNKESYAKKREAIRNLIEQTQDKINISGGMREEWKEFYSDTGVDYETDEAGAGAKLAQQALDVITEGNYRSAEKETLNELDERADYFTNIIDNADREYQKLLRSYKKENRNVALAAIYEWIDGLDSNIKEDYEQRFIYDSRIIDRNENLDKFDKAKRQIIARALEVQNRYGLDKDDKYKEVVKEIMKNLNFLQPNDKAKLTANILDVGSADMLMGQIDSIMDMAKTMEDMNYRRVLQREIHKELQNTKNVKKGSRTVGKYDYRTNKIFEKLRELDKLSSEKANELRLDRAKLAKAEDEGLKYRDKLINKFLSYKANGMFYADTDLMKEIYDEIVRIKLAGKTAKNEQDLQEKLDETKEVEKLVKIVQSKKKGKANLILRGYIDGFGNLESILNGVFNKKVMEEYATEVLYNETQAETFAFEIKDKFEKEVAKIYNLSQWDWDRQIVKYLSEKFAFQENRREYDSETYELTGSLTVEKEMTKMDLILAYMWSMNDTLNKRLINMFGSEQLDLMFEELSVQDVKLAELMLSTAQSTYPLVNKAYIKKYGLDLPKVNAYFPSKVERGTEIDLFNDYSSKSLNNAFTKTRTTSELIPMEFSNPVQILYNHIDGVSKFVYMGESLDKINLVLNNQTFLKPVIIEKFGNDVYKTLKQAMLNCTYKTDSKVYNGIQKIFDYISSNWIVANISTRPIVALKQLLSANNYASEMPVVEWSKGFVKSVFDYKNTIDYMMKIPYVKARLGANMQNEFLKQYVNNSAFARTKKIKDFLAMNVKLGDAGSLILGGKPYIDYLISQGVSESEAIKQFVLQTNRTQQSSAISSMSNFQVSASKQPLVRVFTAYRNAQAQYLRKCADAIVAYSNGDIELKQCAKTVYHYMFLQPFLFNIATSGSLFIWATSGDDEEFWADFKLSLMNLCMDSVGMLAELYNFAIRRIVEGEKYRPVTTPLWGDIQREITKIAKEDASFEDFVAGFGYLLGNIGTGVPVPAIINMGTGIKEMVTDDFLKGLFRTLGYSESRANKMSGK